MGHRVARCGWVALGVVRSGLVRLGAEWHGKDGFVHLFS